MAGSPGHDSNGACQFGFERCFCRHTKGQPLHDYQCITDTKPILDVAATNYCPTRSIFLRPMKTRLHFRRCNESTEERFRFPDFEAASKTVALACVFFGGAFRSSRKNSPKLCAKCWSLFFAVVTCCFDQAVCNSRRRLSAARCSICSAHNLRQAASSASALLCEEPRWGGGGGGGEMPVDFG